MAKRRVIDNQDHDIADAACMERQNLYGWQVTRGKTEVTLQNGQEGVIMDWMSGHFRLDTGYHGYVDEIVMFK